MKRLWLFDVDGTLVNAHGLGRRALERAFAERYGWEAATEGVSFAGGTDPWIVAQVFAKQGLEPPKADELRTFLAFYAQHAAREAETANAEVLPGVVPLLTALAQRSQIGRQAVLTGNCAAGAQIKLQLTGLHEYFACGAYGDVAVQREDLLPAALKRAEATWGERYSPERTVIVGDSLRDVDVALAHGATCVAVTTGWVEREALEAHGAHVVLDDLSDLESTLRILGATG